MGNELVDPFKGISLNDAIKAWKYVPSSDSREILSPVSYVQRLSGSITRSAVHAPFFGAFGWAVLVDANNINTDKAAIDAEEDYSLFDEYFRLLKEAREDSVGSACYAFAEFMFNLLGDYQDHVAKGRMDAEAISTYWGMAVAMCNELCQGLCSSVVDRRFATQQLMQKTRKLALKVAARQWQYKGSGVYREQVLFRHQDSVEALKGVDLTAPHIQVQVSMVPENQAQPVTNNATEFGAALDGVVSENDAPATAKDFALAVQGKLGAPAMYRVRVTRTTDGEASDHVLYEGVHPQCDLEFSMKEVGGPARPPVFSLDITALSFSRMAGLIPDEMQCEVYGQFQEGSLEGHSFVKPALGDVNLKM